MVLAMVLDKIMANLMPMAVVMLEAAN